MCPRLTLFHSQKLRELSTFRQTGYNDCVKIAKIIAEENDINLNFPQKRVARSTRQFDYEGVDEVISNEEENFRIEYFLLITDQAIQSFKKRFQQYEELKTNFGFLYDFKKIQNLSSDDLLKCCKNLHTLLEDEDGVDSDIDGTELFEEMRSLLHVVPENNQNCLIDVLRHLCESKLNLVYPNVYIAIRILLTLPVTIATAERSFSKLKLIKNYLRSTTSQERLVGMAMISIEREIVKETDFSNVINDQ